MGEGELPFAGCFLTFIQGRIAIWSHKDFAMAPASFGGQRPLFTRSFIVYLLSCADGTTYVGGTTDISERVHRHDQGWVPATKGRRPVSLLMYVVFPDRYEAYAFEKYLKSGSGRAFSARHFLRSPKPS